MIDKSTPEWQAFKVKAQMALLRDRITRHNYDELLLCEHPERAEERLQHMVRGDAEVRLLRDMWQAERDARNRWWITAGIAAASVLVVLLALYYSSKP